MQIREISTFEYLLYYGKIFPKILLHYSTSMYMNSVIYMLFDEDKPIGVANFSKENEQIYTLNYIYIAEDMRGKSLSSLLMRESIERLYHKGAREILSRTVGNNTEKIFKSFGFSLARKGISISCSGDSETAEIWERYISKKKQYISKWIAMNDIRVCSFEEAGEDIKNYIYDLKNNSFPKNLDAPDIAMGKCGSFAQDISYIAIKDNEPIAYTMLSRAAANSVVFSIVNTSDDYKGMGVYIIPFIHSMDRILEAQFKSVCYVILDENSDMMRVFANMLAKFPHKKNKQLYWKMELC